MSDPCSLFFYVEDPAASAAFYADLLGKPPIETHPDFVMFVLDSHMALGFWRKSDVDPAPLHTGGGMELAFKVDTPEEVIARHKDWESRGLRFVQSPTQMDFGFTCVALDPDGHRLRVYAMTEPCA